MRSQIQFAATLVLASCTSPVTARQPAATSGPAAAASASDAAPHRRLRVALYPLVPDRDGVFKRVAAKYRELRPAVDLEDVDLTNNYYDPDLDDSIMKSDAQILEIDAVFLDDSITAGRLATLPSSVKVEDNDFAPVARGVGVRDGVRYAVPHWLCSNYLYTTKALAPKLTTWAGTKQALTASLAAGHGLLIDLMGKTTLGELYFDSAFDALNDVNAVLPTLEDPSKRYQPALQSIVDAQGLCAEDFCRVKAFHNTAGAYARQFARGRGAAFVGYSEELFFLLDEVRNQCGNASCTAESDVEILPFTFSEKGDHPFAFVDSLAINAATCTGDCIEDAAVFIAMMNDDATLKSILVPGGSKPPLYLLPARTTGDADLTSGAPLYPKLRTIISGAVAVQGKKLGRELRTVGAEINNDPKMRPPKP